MAQIYVFAILGLILLGLAYILYLRDKFQKAVIGHIWATFLTKTGSRADALCHTNGDIVIPPQGLLSDNPTPIEYVVPATKYNFSYPPLFPSFMQATVPSAIYIEGNPEPLGRKEGDAPQITDKLLHSLRNEESAALMMRAMGQFFQMDEILEAIKNTGGAKTAIYISLGVLVLVAILAYMNYHLSAQVGQLLRLYGL